MASVYPDVCQTQMMSKLRIVQIGRGNIENVAWFSLLDIHWEKVGVIYFLELPPVSQHAGPICCDLSGHQIFGKCRNQRSHWATTGHQASLPTGHPSCAPGTTGQRAKDTPWQEYHNTGNTVSWTIYTPFPSALQIVPIFQQGDGGEGHWNKCKLVVCN